MRVREKIKNVRAGAGAGAVKFQNQSAGAVSAPAPALRGMDPTPFLFADYN